MAYCLIGVLCPRYLYMSFTSLCIFLHFVVLFAFFKLLSRRIVRVRSVALWGNLIHRFLVLVELVYPLGYYPSPLLQGLRLLNFSTSSSGWCPLSQKNFTPNGERAIVDCYMLYRIRTNKKRARVNLEFRSTFCRLR